MNLTEAMTRFNAGENNADANNTIRIAANGLIGLHDYAMFDENGERYEMGEGPDSHDICDRLSVLLEALGMEV